MSFLYPTFLFGLLCVAIPVIVHLFNFQRPKEVRFTNVRFLKNIQQESNRNLKLKHLLILLARILFILFLVLAFAQPFLKGINPSILKGEKTVSLYLDNSFSMENDVDGSSAFDIAAKAASDVTGLFSPSTNYLLLSNDFEGKDQYLKNKEKLGERLTELTYSPGKRTFSEVVKRNNSLLTEQNKAKKLFFYFTDFQKSTLGDLSKLKLDSNTAYYLLPIQNTAVPNIYIDSAWLATPFVRVNKNNILHVRVVNAGKEAVKNYKVKLFLDSNQVSLTTVSIPAKASVVTDLSFSANQRGLQRGVVSIEDYPIKFDNNYYFMLDVGASAHIYSITDSGNKSIEKVFSTEETFSLKTVSSGAVDYSQFPLSDIVFIDGVKEISAGLKDAVNAYLKNGGTVVVFPSSTVDIASYQNAFPELALSVVEVDTSRKEEFILQIPDYKNPFFKGVFEKEEAYMQMPFAFPVVKAASPGTSILKFKNNASFCSKYSVNGGNLFLFSAPLNPSYSDFSHHSLFVPVMYKLVLDNTKAAQLAFNLRDPFIAIKTNATEKDAVFSLQSGSVKFVPSQKNSSNILYLDLPRKMMKAGFYELAGGKEKKYIAFNYAPEESSMDFYSKDALAKQFAGNKNVHIYDLENGEQFAKVFKNENIGTPLWKYCLILALSFLLSEILLIRFL